MIEVRRIQGDTKFRATSGSAASVRGSHMTVRSELISAASTRLRVWWHSSKKISQFGGMEVMFATPEEALEAIIDECKACAPGSLGAQMLEYYRSLSELAHTRLVNAVMLKAEITRLINS